MLEVAKSSESKVEKKDIKEEETTSQKSDTEEKPSSVVASKEKPEKRTLDILFFFLSSDISFITWSHPKVSADSLSTGPQNPDTGVTT